MVLSILIVNWNTRVYLNECLKSIFLHPPSCTFEVIVVDNASTDDSANMVEASYPQVILLRQTSNLGYANGNNAAFAAASGAFLLTLNPDTEVFDDTLNNAVAILESAPNYGALCAQQIGLEGEVQASVRGFPTLLGIFGQLLGLAKLFPNSAFGTYQLPGFDYLRAQDAPQPMGTFILFRRSSLDDVGMATQPMDSAFPIFFNEVDLLYRMHRSGWPCWYDPSIRIRHVGGAGTRQVRKPMIWESHLSLLRYYRKHWPDGLIGILMYPVFAIAVLLGALIRARGFHRGFRS